VQRFCLGEYEKDNRDVGTLGSMFYSYCRIGEGLPEHGMRITVKGERQDANMMKEAHCKRNVIILTNDGT